MLRWLKCTLYEKWIIGTDGSNILKIWIDSSYGVLIDMRGQSGDEISMGHGTVMCKYTKQKLNGKA